MALLDMPLAQLEKYKPQREEPSDFDDFWQRTLAESKSFPLEVQFEAVDFGLKLIDAYDVTFNGYKGQKVKGWFLLPRQVPRPLPCVVEYIWYGGGRGYPIDWLLWPSAGFAHFVMDTRGQGSNLRHGDTPDMPDIGSSPHWPGFMTLGVLDPETYYYRRVFVDAVRALGVAQTHTAVDPHRIAITGGSQGGGITLAVAGLETAVVVAMPEVPFLCHYRRATELVDTNPYFEITRFLRTHRDKVAEVFQTLSYFDGVNFAARAQAQALFSVGLMDDICPPSTVYAAYNHYQGPKEMRTYSFNNHEGGGSHHALEKVRYLQNLWPL